MARENANVFVFRDRRDAGGQLASRLSEYAFCREGLVVALPRGGVPVAYEVSRALGLPLEILVVRKVGAPGHSELAVGAIASGGYVHRNEDLIHQIGISAEAMDQLIHQERSELERREQAYREGKSSIGFEGKTVIVDDGLATGASMEVAVEAVRTHSPMRIVVGVPVAPLDTLKGLSRIVEDVVCVVVPDSFQSVGRWYRDFTQVTDDEVRTLTRELHAPSVESSP